MICILTEKPSAARNFAIALGGKSGVYKGEEYVITNSVGHIFAFPTDVENMVDVSKASKYKSWNTKYLPWDEKDFKWRKELDPTKKDIYKNIKQAYIDAHEIVIATDNDPSGEGTLLADEILLSFRADGKKFTRMFFEDESPKSIRKAFENRQRISSLIEDPDYIKADYRSKWDYLSMQFTRIASECAGGYMALKGGALRNGRLKSFMNTLVGDGLKAFNEYKPVPSYQDAFIDEEGVWYLKKNNKQYPEKSDVDLSKLYESEVIPDSTVTKKTPPPKLLDLAALSAILASKGYKSSYVLNTYQKMYEDSVVSYPRTEDSVITLEQFNDLLPNIEKIADVIKIDKRHLTHRNPRSTHVQTNAAHGANRPGPNVPNSLTELDQKYGKGASVIYSTLATNTLTMFCEDYVYDVISGHVKDFPDYKGSVSTPVSLGFKKIWTDPDEDDNLKEKKLGKSAKPAIKEMVPKRPPYPTMKWLMKQLEKYNVGTGATRTSVYAEITSEKSKCPLMKDVKGRITLTSFGEINYRLLQGTLIGSSKLTEQLQAEMKEIAKGKVKDTKSLLDKMKEYVLHDLNVMQNNRQEYSTENKKEKVQGFWNGEEVSFNKVWGGHEFSENEINKLLAGETIKFSIITKNNTNAIVEGRLERQTYMKRNFIGFKMLNMSYPDSGNSSNKTVSDRANGIWRGKSISFKKVFSGHEFTDEEIDQLLKGKTITIAATKKNGDPYTVSGKLANLSYNGRKYVGFKPDFGN